MDVLVLPEDGSPLVAEKWNLTPMHLIIVK